MKATSWEAMFYHCAIYSGTFLVFGKVSLLFAAILFVSHFMIDPLKARWKIVKQVWVDQMMHFWVILLGVYFGL